MHDGALDFPVSEVGSDEAGKSALVDKGSTAALDSTVSRKRGDEPVGLSRGGVGWNPHRYTVAPNMRSCNGVESLKTSLLGTELIEREWQACRHAGREGV